MTATSELEQRTTELEIKVSFQEDLIDKLDQVVIRQQCQIDALVHEVLALRQRNAPDADNTPRNLRDELPPHY
jgi:SlyX protein